VRARRQMLARAEVRRMWDYRRIRLEAEVRELRAEYEALIARGAPRLKQPSNHFTPIALLTAAGTWYALKA